MQQWRDAIPVQQAYRRAGGRRGYNAVRQIRARLRRNEILARMVVGTSFLPLINRGAQARLAEEFRVHRSTIHRDIGAIFAELREAAELKESVRRALVDWASLPYWCRPDEYVARALGISRQTARREIDQLVIRLRDRPKKSI